MADRSSLSRRRVLGATAAGAAMTVLPIAGRAQSYPDRPIRLIVGVPPSQSTDVISRLVAQKAGEFLKQQIVVDNRPGAGGIISQEAGKTAAADGYTLVMTSTSTAAINPTLYRKLPYHPLDDFEPVIAFVAAPLFLVTNKATPVNNVREMVAHIKEKGSAVSYGSTGNGATQHIAMEMLKKAANFELTHIPYKGAPPMITDLIADRIQFAFDVGPSILPFARNGQVKLLGITSALRSAVAPEVPTIAEQGVPGFAATAWASLMAPKGTPRGVIELLNNAFNRALQDPVIAAELTRRGSPPTGGTPAELREFMQAEYARWGEAVRRSGATVD